MKKKSLKLRLKENNSKEFIIFRRRCPYRVSNKCNNKKNKMLIKDYNKIKINCIEIFCPKFIGSSYYNYEV